MIKKYRKKPVTVSAIKNTGEWPPILAWLDELAGGRMQIPYGRRPPLIRDHAGRIRIETLEGIMRAEVGDYIIRGVQGEFYPCKPDIFEQTYEEVI